MKKISLKAFDHHALPGNNPAREWAVMLSAFAVLVLCCFAFSGYLFFAIGQGSLSSEPPAPASPQAALDPKAIQAVIDSYAAAPSRTGNLVAGGRLFVDPSL